MNLLLTGVKRITGSAAPGVPSDARFPVLLAKNSTLTLTMTLVSDNGAQPSLVGMSYVLTVRKRSADPPVLTKTVTGLLRGNVVVFTINPADTLYITLGRYFYDVVEVAGSGAREVLVPTSPFELSQP